MRDKIKNEEYFEDFIKEDTLRIVKFKTKLLNNEIAEDRILSVNTKIHDLELGILIANYSCGKPIDDLVKDYIQLIKDLPQIWTPNFYIKNLWLISLGILFNVEDSVMEVIASLIKKSDINDWLYNFLLEYKNKNANEITGTLLFPKVYGKLQDIILDDEINRAKLLNNYINNTWYETHKECGWYDSHKSDQKLYYGYWSFEAGAIAKVLNIIDDNLKDSLYYPYDLVHYDTKY